MKPLPPSNWDESLQSILDDMSGRPLNVHGLMANHPQLLKSWWKFRNYSIAGGDLRQRECELVILRVSARLKVWYEWASHVVRGQASGLSMQEIERVREGPAAAGWNERDSALLTAVDELIETRGISASAQRQLGQYFSSNQIMDVIAIHGMYVTLACMINTWGLELDAHVRERLPESMTRENFMSRL